MMKKVAFATLALMAVLDPSLANTERGDIVDVNVNNTASELIKENDSGLLQSRGNSEPHFCKEIRSSWWGQRSHFQNTWPNTDKEARNYCSQYDGKPEACIATEQSKNREHSMAMCEIEGHGHNGKCVPVMCAWLNQGKCNYQSTGGMCQWFEKSPHGRGCMKNPCNLAGRPQNDKNFCENDTKFLKELRKYSPKVECAWCNGGMGCSNVDPKPKGGCAPINDPMVNRVARQAANQSKKFGQILQMRRTDKGYKNTGCGDKSQVTRANVSPIECIEGQIGCSRELGFKPKYPEPKRKLRQD